MRGLAGMPPKYFSAKRRTSSGSTSPTTDTTALLGAYQVWKKPFTSSTRGGVEVLHRADRRVVVRVLGREQVRLELLVPRAVGPVVVAPALLVLHDLALVVEVLLAERLEERAHPVRLEPERELHLVARHGLEVVRAVEPGGAVHRAAGGLDERDVLRLADVRASPGTSRARRGGRSPVLPGTSCFEPTPYQTLTATTGARWSSATIRRRPLGRRSSMNRTRAGGMGWTPGATDSRSGERQVRRLYSRRPDRAAGRRDRGPTAGPATAGSRSGCSSACSRSW